MICPECNGNGFIQIPSMWESNQSPFTNMIEINCPTCEGDGELPDTAAAKHCLACGEPINAGQDWCAEHKGAAFVSDRI